MDDPIRVLQLTDTHLFDDRHTPLRGVITYESLAGVLRHYRAGRWRANFAIVSGDIANDNGADAYRHFSKLLASLDMPVHCIPGNHDVRDAMRRTLTGEPFRYCTSAESGDWCFIGLDSCLDNSAAGLIDDGEFQRLDDALSLNARPHALVYLHHPPVALGSKWLDAVGLTNGGEFMRRIGQYDSVRAVLFGHVHQPYEQMHGSVQLIGTPSTCRQFAARSDTFATDDRPPAYRQLELFADGRLSSELIWVDQFSPA